MFKNKRFKRKVKEDDAKSAIEAKRGLLKPIDENATMKNTTKDDNIFGKTKGINEDIQVIEVHSSEDIPASQEPTQRYLSQRSNFTCTLSRTQSRSLTQRPPNTYFELVLMKSGVQLDGESFELSCDHIAFVCKLREVFIKSQNISENIESFKTGLRDALKTKSKFVEKLVSGCAINLNGEENVYQSQDSMIDNFLLVEFLREHVIEVLLERISEAACEAVPPVTNNQMYLLPLLLVQLRYVKLTHGDLVFERICKVFRKCSERAKADIIAAIEFILEPSKHDDFVQMILDNISNNKDLFQINTMQSLTNLCLSHRMQGIIRDRIVEFVKGGQCPSKILPMLMKFLLKALNNNGEDNCSQLVKTVREILTWRTDACESDAVADQHCQMQMFQCVEQGLTCSREFYNAWQKTIASMKADNFTSTDLIVLLLLIRIKGEDSCLYIQNILRRLIKSDDITVDIVIDAKAKYHAMLECHIDTLLNILDDFLHEKDASVVRFTRASYGILFEIGDSAQKNIVRKLVAMICNRSIKNMTNKILDLIKDLQHRHSSEMQNWMCLLMPLLDHLGEMSLSQTRIVMNVLCSLEFGASDLREDSTVHHHIDMLVKKQIISRMLSVRKQGIVGVVQLIDAIARMDENPTEANNLDVTYGSVDDLPDGCGKIAAQYTARAITINCSESLALFYDELAAVCSTPLSERLNAASYSRAFLAWFCDLSTYSFQRNYIICDADESTEIRHSGIRLSYQKCINTPEDICTEDSEMELIVVNIAGLVLQPAEETSSSIVVLAPLFNMVRSLHMHRYEGSLELINALLGCAIALPTFFDEPEGVFHDFEAEARRKILDIYFYCINWIRELISSFSTQDDNMIRKKVLMRLNDLIRIERNMHILLARAPANYVLPACQFTMMALHQPGRLKAPTKHNRDGCTNTKRRPIDGNVNPDTQMSATPAMKGIKLSTPANVKNDNNSYAAKEMYRQMDPNIMLLLREHLTLEYPLPSDEIGKNIGLDEYRFILYDLTMKMESIAGIDNQQYVAKPLYFINDLSKFLSVVQGNMEMILRAIREKLKDVKYIYGDGDLFTESFAILKVNFGLSLRLLAAYLSWSQFISANGNIVELLKSSLIALLNEAKSSDQTKKKSNDMIAMELFERYLQLELNIVDLKTAIYLYRLLTQLRKLATNGQNRTTLQKQDKDIRSLCKTFLLRKWFNYDGHAEKGAACNNYLSELVQGFLWNSNLRRQSEIVRVVLYEVKLLDAKDGALKSFPNFKKSNFHLLYRGLCEILITTVNDLIVLSANPLSEEFRIWEKSCELVTVLQDIVMAVNLPRIYQLFLKYSHQYLKLVLQHGIQTIEKFLRQNSQRVIELFNMLHVVTLFLHKLCCQSKASKNTAIVVQIPLVRETVESLVHSVKKLLVANKCSSAFWMGNLKNKDLHGDEVKSHSNLLTDDDASHDSDEELPDDDVSVDETIMVDNDTGNGQKQRRKSSSRSKCF